MTRRIAERLFGLYLLAVPFVNMLPDVLHIPWIGTNYSRLIFHAVLAATVGLVVRERFWRDEDRWILIWFAFYLAWRLISLSCGFWNADIWLPEDMSRRWLFVRFAKRMFCDDHLLVLLVTYFLFRNRPRKAASVFERSILTVGVILAGYGLFETTGTFFGVEWVRSSMSWIANHLWSVAKFNGWWPPALWTKQQLRSLTQEPSYFAIVLLLALPAVAIGYETAKGYAKRTGYLVLATILLLCLWLTKSRTAMVGLAVELAILTSRMLLVQLHWRRRLARVAGVAILVAVTFLGALWVIRCGRSQWKTDGLWGEACSYVESHVETVASKNARSNSSRRESLLAHLEVARDHPILGVGPLMLPYHLHATRVAQESQVREMRRWVWRYNPDCWKSGKCGMPSLCVYARVLADSGVIGLLLFLTVPMVILTRLIRRGIPDDGTVLCLMTQALVGGMLLLSTGWYIEYDFVLWAILLLASEGHQHDCARQDRL